MGDIDRLLRLRDIQNGYYPGSRSHILDLVKRGLFPAPIKLSPRISVWRESEVAKHMQKLIERSTDPEQGLGDDDV